MLADPMAALYVAAILAGRLDAANGALAEVKRQLETGKPHDAVARTVDKIAELLSNVKVTAASVASWGIGGNREDDKRGERYAAS